MSLVNATPLDATVISEMLPTHTRDALDIVVLDIVGSTNDVVREGAARQAASRVGGICRAANRRPRAAGKTWHSPREQISTVLSAGNARAPGVVVGSQSGCGAILAESVARTSAYNCSSNGRTTFLSGRKLGGVLVELLGEQTAGTMR